MLKKIHRRWLFLLTVLFLFLLSLIKSLPLIQENHSQYVEDTKEKNIESFINQSSIETSKKRLSAQFPTIEMNDSNSDIQIKEIHELFNDIKSGDPKTQVQAIRSLILSRDIVMPFILEALQDQDAQMREIAVELLGEMGAKEHVNRLMKILHSDRECLILVDTFRLRKGNVFTLVARDLHDRAIVLNDLSPE